MRRSYRPNFQYRMSLNSIVSRRCFEPTVYKISSGRSFYTETVYWSHEYPRARIGKRTLLFPYSTVTLRLGDFRLFAGFVPRHGLKKKVELFSSPRLAVRIKYNYKERKKKEKKKNNAIRIDVGGERVP